MMTRLALFALTSFLATTTYAGGGQGIPIRFGWGYEIKTVGDVDPASELGRGVGEGRASIAISWDQFWLALPVWCSNREYLMHEKVDEVANDTELYLLKEQTTEGVARLSGLPLADLKFPFYAYLPTGWIILAATLAFVQLISGPSPKKRFSRLREDDDYMNALTQLILTNGDTDGAEEDDDLDAVFQAKVDHAIEFLVRQGISRGKAERNLQFMIGYLNSHPDALVTCYSIKPGMSDSY